MHWWLCLSPGSACSGSLNAAVISCSAQFTLLWLRRRLVTKQRRLLILYTSCYAMCKALLYLRVPMSCDTLWSSFCFPSASVSLPSRYPIRIDRPPSIALVLPLAKSSISVLSPDKLTAAYDQMTPLSITKLNTHTFCCECIFFKFHLF